MASRTEYEQVLAWKAQLDKEYPDSIPLYLSVGVHPWRADRVDEDFEEDYECLLSQADCIGKIGMDSVWTNLFPVERGSYFQKNMET